MANYDVTFETTTDSSNHGRTGRRTLHIEGVKSAKEAVLAAVPRLMEPELASKGYVAVFNLRGEVERDTYRGAANDRVAGYRSTFGVRRGGQFNQPTWNFVFTVHTSPLRWETKLERVQ
jgi:hypothetical protein